MTVNTYQKILEDTILNVFENMYYMFPEKQMNNDDHFSFPLSCFYTKVSFCTNQKKIILWGTKQLAAKMAKNFLGEDRAFSNAELIDIFKEAANVIIGNFISASDSAPDIRFQVPVISEKQIMQYDKDISNAVDLVYIIENEFFRIALAA